MSNLAHNKKVLEPEVKHASFVTDGNVTNFTGNKGFAYFTEIGHGMPKGEADTCPLTSAEAETLFSNPESLIEEVVHRSNMIKSYRHVIGKRGAPGIDGITVDQLKTHCETHWPQIRQELLEGTYMPQSIRRVEIPKPGGGVRVKYVRVVWEDGGREPSSYPIDHFRPDAGYFPR